MSLRLVAVLALMGAVVVFAAQNAVAVELRFFAWTLALSPALLLFFALIAGFLGGWTARAWIGWRRARRADADRRR